MKRYLALLIAFTPFCKLRVFLYRYMLGYDVSWGARIAPFTVIVADRCRIERVRIGPFNYLEAASLDLAEGVVIGRLNRLKWLRRLRVGENTSISSSNTMCGTRPGISPFKMFENVDIGSGCTITNRHSFDVSDEITVGHNVTVAGSGTQFWTHGFDINRVKIQGRIIIGNNGYIGSRSIVVQGVSIADDVVIGAGTTVSRSITSGGFYVSAVLTRKGDIKSYGESFDVTTHNGYCFVRKEYEN